MHWIRTIIVMLVLMWVVGACIKQPEDSVIPDIEFQSLAFKNEFQSTKKFDTLILTLKFRDGDGDLGLNPNETAIYTSATDSTDINSPFYYVYDTTKNTVWYPTHSPNDPRVTPIFKYVNYASSQRIHSHPFDTLPPLTCKNWEQRSNPASILYIQINPYSNNIFVDVYIKNANGTYTYFDPTKVYPFGESCSPNFFNARFPVLSSDQGKASPLRGTLTYKIQSAALCIFLCGKTIKVKTYILDRAFHKSNVAESDDFIVK